MAAGGLLLGPLGALVAGAGFKKDRQYDMRELYLLVEAPAFASIGQFNPDTAAQVREFAFDVNNASRAALGFIPGAGVARAGAYAQIEPSGVYQRHGIQPEPPRVAAPSVADEIDKLAALKERGLLTEEEFNAQKAKLLG